MVQLELLHIIMPQIYDLGLVMELMAVEMQVVQQVDHIVAMA
jgi:hypothetical protein